MLPREEEEGRTDKIEASKKKIAPRPAIAILRFMRRARSTTEKKPLKPYKSSRIALSWNQKTADAATIDVARGCPGCELSAAPCYAKKMAQMAAIDHGCVVSQRLSSSFLETQLETYKGSWIRIGCTSDPSLDWAKTAQVVESCLVSGIIPVIVSKIHEPIPDYSSLVGAQLQVSVSGLQTAEQSERRLHAMIVAKAWGIQVVMRLVSAVWIHGSAEEAEQERMVAFARAIGIEILETPLRIYSTSSIYQLVEKSQYHRHVSPISGLPATEYTAGLVVADAKPCFSTCSPPPTEHDPRGCAHQCCTR